MTEYIAVFHQICDMINSAHYDMELMKAVLSVIITISYQEDYSCLLLKKKIFEGIFLIGTKPDDIVTQSFIIVSNLIIDCPDAI
jgi:hypothetical protein